MTGNWKQEPRPRVVWQRLLFSLWLAAVPGLQAGPAGPITWGDTVTIGGGWGRMVALTNGQWLCVTTRYPVGTNSNLRISRSLNNGRNWSTLATVAVDGRTLDNGELTVRPNGEVLLSMRSLVPNLSYQLPVYMSTNNGLTWNYRSNIDTSDSAVAQQGRGLWEPDFWGLEDGRLVVTYSNEKHDGYSQMISERVSTDHGLTWSSEIWAVTQTGGGSLRPGMSQMARMANGKYILVYEVVNSGNADVHYKISDDGVNWPAGLGTRIPCQHCGPFVLSLPNGLLLVTSCENEVSFSEDFGATWQKLDPPAWPGGFVWTWPAIYFVPTNELAVMAVTNGVKLKFGTLAPRPNWPNPVTNNFDAGTDVGWSRYGGNFALSNGCYVLNNAGTNGKALMGDGFWRDGVVEADVMLNTAGNAGLMFRTTNPDYDGPDAALGYYVGLDTAGFVVLGRMSNSWTALTSRPVSVGTNIWHRLRVGLSGSMISVFVDDLNVAKFTQSDASFPRGQIGVRAFQCNAQFDNVTFSNALPFKLDLKRAGQQSRLTWPETSVSVKLVANDVLSGGSALTNVPLISNRTFQVSVDSPGGRAFYWLRAE